MWHWIKFDAYKQTTIFTNGSILDPCMCVYIYNCYGSSEQIFFFFKSQNSKVRLDVGMAMGRVWVGYTHTQHN